MTTESIQLIDDEVTYLKTIIKYLEEEEEPYNLLQALSVDQAFTILATETPALIIVDWDMPGRNGIDFVQMLQAIDEFKDIPVIMS
jgi:two-component system phosphate regulon response regulator PhoB